MKSFVILYIIVLLIILIFAFPDKDRREDLNTSIVGAFFMYAFVALVITGVLYAIPVILGLRLNWYE